MGKKKLAVKSQKANVISVKWDATFFFERAVQSLDKFHYDKALKYFRRAVEYEPDNSVNHCNMAGILSEMGDYAESNNILKHIVEVVDPNLMECYFYMANNYANMEDYESAEKALVHYLEHDPVGQFLDEAEEMMEFLSYELDRPTKLKNIKCREALFEHDKARHLLEEGKFIEAVRVLEKLVKKHPEFLAAHNNLALAYYYIGDLDRSMACIDRVLNIDPGNLHALCNLAVFCQYSGNSEQLQTVVGLLTKTYPFQQEHVFKLATTMGILGEHAAAYRHFKRLLKYGDTYLDPCLYHYAAVAACNTGRYREAKDLWLRTEKLDPGSEIPRFYLSELEKIKADPDKPPLSYHYYLPFEERHRTAGKTADEQLRDLSRDPLTRSSFFWALRYGDFDTKLQVIQAFALIQDREVEEALRKFLLNPEENDYLKKVALFVLRMIGVKEPLQVILEGKMATVSPTSPQLPPDLPKWESAWQKVLEGALRMTTKRFDIIQQHDLETLWVEFLTRSAEQTPAIYKPLYNLPSIIIPPPTPVPSV